MSISTCHSVQNVYLEVGHITRNEFVQLGKLGAVEALCLECDVFLKPQAT